MRASLNKLKEAEDFISGAMKPQDDLLFRAKLLLDPILRMSVLLQKKVYFLIRYYGRQELLREIDAVHEKLFSTPAKTDLRKKVNQLFPKS